MEGTFDMKRILCSSSAKTIIFKQLGTLKTTSEDNFNARIWDARKIQKWDGFTTPDEIISYSVKYFNANPNDFIVDESAID